MLVSMDKQTLTPAEFHALKIIAKEADALRGSLVEGKSVPLDFGVHIVGDLIVNQSSQFNLSAKPSAELLVAGLLSKWGPRQRVAIVEELLEAGLTKAMKDPEQTKALAETLISGLTTRELTTRRGAVTGKFELTPVRPGV